MMPGGCLHINQQRQCRNQKIYESFARTILQVTKSLFPIYRSQFKTIFRFAQIPLLHICNIKFDNAVMTLEVIFRLNMSIDSQKCEDVFRFGAGLQNIVRFKQVAQQQFCPLCQ
jgi:hypothetical protein